MQHILSTVRQAVDKYGMIEENDTVAVGLSGGKETLSIAYEPNVTAENFREQLAKNQFQEIKQRKPK